MRHLHIYYNAPYLLSPKSNITSDFHFSWVLQPSQEKLKTMLMQNFGVTNTVHYGRCARGVWRNQRASQHLVRYTAVHTTLLPTLALHEDTKNGCVTDCRTLGRAGLKR